MLFCKRPSKTGCAIYYYPWISLIPKLRGYRIRQVVLDVDDGAAQSHQLVKVPAEELADWDATHDSVGRTLGAGGGSGGVVRHAEKGDSPARVTKLIR